MGNFNNYWNYFINSTITYAPKVLLAIITLIIGLWIIKKIAKLIDRVMRKRDVDKSLMSFFSSMASIGLKILLIISVIQMVGIETTSFVAILASVGFAVGMALQGSLGNFAGGVLILFFKPFKVGDYIQTQGFEGMVQSIQIFSTVLLTPDNKRIIIPNGPISNGPVTNFTAEKTRRLDFSFAIGSNNNIINAKEVIKAVLDGDSRILKEPLALIAVGQVTDVAINITVRVWCSTDDYWNIFFDINEIIKNEFDKAGIIAPLTKTEVHVVQH